MCSLKHFNTLFISVLVFEWNDECGKRDLMIILFCWHIQSRLLQVQYESHNIHEETPVGRGGGLSEGAGWSPAGVAGGGGSQGGSSSRKSAVGTSGMKRASLFTWLTLQSIQRETF